MIFSSIVFLFVFLPALLLIYYVVPKSWKNVVLLLASLLFYAWGEPVYIFLMLFSIIVNYVFGMEIELEKKKAKDTLFFAVGVNLFLLFFFKYYSFCVETVNRLAGTDFTAHVLALPVGISFYTFQSLSYLIDVYRGKTSAQKNFISFALYISMFPQLIAGPIVQYSDIEAQLKERRTGKANFGVGAEYFVKGLGKKVLLANSMGLIFEQIQILSGADRSVLGAWIGALAYTLQIYFDFSGYSDMAVGLGRMFGFRFPKNFQYPYVSASVTEFWRRWHISLSSWFRDYVYIPLGGNRVSQWKHIRNILVVWTLTGLWHGASWNFVLWGLYYGVILILEKYWLQKWYDRFPIVGHVSTGIAVIFGWMLFANTSFVQLGGYIAAMFGANGVSLINDRALYYLSANWVLFLIGCIGATPFPYRWNKKMRENHPVSALVINGMIFILCVAGLVYQSYNPFLYFRF